MSILVTAASGHLGRSVVEHLLSSGTPAADIVAGARATSSLDDLAARGVAVRRVDYSDTASLPDALDGVDTLLLVSGNEFGQRVQQHTAVALAAAQVGVSRLVYTSAPHADATPLALAADHAATEAAIRRTGLAATFLRNGWYFENYTSQIPTYLELGAVFGSAGDGAISGASRSELAEAAAVVLTTGGHEDRTYELGGDEPFTLAELASLVAAASGREVVYRDVPQEEYAAILAGAGLPAPVADVFAQTDVAIRDGALRIDTGDLSALIGRPTSTLAEAVRDALDAPV
jgi:NAD(P)H dehydrogenase (quinone)